MESNHFFPSSVFQGAKSGFYFSTGAQGVGYYRDPYAVVVDKPAETEAPATSSPDDVWVQCFDEESKRNYWFNERTGGSSWEPPATEWTRYRDNTTKKIYRFNAQTGETKWEEDQSSTDKKSKSPVKDETKSISLEEKTWSTHVDERSGRTYWFNKRTGESRWTAPDVEKKDEQPVSAASNGVKETANAATHHTGLSATIASWLPKEETKAPTKPKYQEYSFQATFNRNTEAFDDASGMDYFSRNNKPSDKAGRQMSNYFALSEFEKNREDAKKIQEKLRKKRNIDWRAYKEKQKKKRYMRNNEWLFKDD